MITVTGDKDTNVNFIHSRCYLVLVHDGDEPFIYVMYGSRDWVSRCTWMVPGASDA